MHAIVLGTRTGSTSCALRVCPPSQDTAPPPSCTPGRQVTEVFVGLQAQWEHQYRGSPGLPPTYAPDERFHVAAALDGRQLAALFEANRCAPRVAACSFCVQQVQTVFVGIALHAYHTSFCPPARRRGQGPRLYQLEAGGASRDHEWVIEQLPGQQGYRVLQSYMWAYS